MQSMPTQAFRPSPMLGTSDICGQVRGIPSLSHPLNQESSPNGYPSHFGTLPASAQWRDVERPIHTNNDSEARLDSRTGPPNSPATWHPEFTHCHGGPSTAWRAPNTGPVEDSRSPECRKRNASRDFQRPYLKEMASAHAENRDPNVLIPVDNSG